MNRARQPKDGRFQQYVDYIRNTGRVPLPADMFDDDWEPVGPMVRRDMDDAKLIVQRPVGIFLTDKLPARLCADLTDAELTAYMRRP